MFRHLRIPAAMAALLFGVSAAVASAAVGTVGGLGSAVEIDTDTHMSFIDLVRGATQDGSYSTATIEGGACTSGSVMLKFYRPDLSGTSLSFLAKRGPFLIDHELVTVNLSPPVDLLEGDLVGITQLTPACGNVSLTVGGGNATLSFPGDSGDADLTACDPLVVLIPQFIGVIVRTTGTSERGGVVLGAGSVQGAQGSNFKTSMQLVNTAGETATMNGRLIFHPQGQPGSPNDPSLAYSIPGGGITLSFPDVVAAIGGSGLGSIDVVPDSSPAPLVLTRIFNDAGAAGTTGFSEPMVRPGDNNVIESGQNAWLVAPSDLTKFRMNVAVRSLIEGASLTINVFDGTGVYLGTVSKNYPGDTFDLESVTGYLGALAPPANGLIEIVVTAGKAIVAGITVDNTTNDTGVAFGTRNHF